MAQLPASSSKLARDVGDQAVTVSIAGTQLAAGDLDGYTIRRGRGNVDEQPTAATCTLNVHAAALPELPAVGDDLVVELGPDALSWLEIDGAGSPARTPAVASSAALPAYGTSSTLPIPVPAGVAAGDLVLACIYVESDAAVTAPAGFQLLGLAENDTSGALHRVYVYWRRATGADSGTYDFSWPSAVFRDGEAVRITGAPVAGDPLDGTVQTFTRAGGSATPDPLALTTTVDDSLLVYVSGSYNSNSSWTPPAGFTEQVDAGGLATSTKQLGTAGPSGDVAGTSSVTSATSVLLFAVRATPAVPGGGANDPAVPRFVGTVTDASIVPGRFTDTGKDVVQVIAASRLAKLGRTFIGDVPWPQDLDTDRATRILREANAVPVTGDPAEAGFVTWDHPDLSTGSTVGDGFQYTRTGATRTWSRVAAGSFTLYEVTDAAASSAHTYWLGHTVTVTPGLAYRVRVKASVSYGSAGGQVDGINLVLGPESSNVAGPSSSSDFFGPAVAGAETALYLVPAGVTSLDVGVELVGAFANASGGASPLYLDLEELTVTGYTITEPGQLDSRAYADRPDLRVGSAVGDDFIYGATGYQTLERNAAGSTDAFRSWANDTAAGTNGAAYPAKSYYLGHLVPCTPGVAYRLTLAGTFRPAGSWSSISLVIGDPTDTGAERTQLAGPGEHLDVNFYGLNGATANDEGSWSSTVWTAPEGVTEIQVGWEVIALDRAVDNTFAALNIALASFTWQALNVQGTYLEAVGGTVQVIPRDVDRQNALQLLTDLALDARGLVLDNRAGQVGYADADDRFGAPVAITLDDSECIVGSQWSTGLGGVVNDAVIRYGSTEPQAELRVTDDASVATHGTIGISRSTQLARQVDAQLVADRIVTLMSLPHYRMPTLIVDALRTLTSSAQRLALLRLDQSALIELTDFPASGPLATGQLWLEGYTERLSAQGWRFELQVSDFLAGGPNTLEEA